MTARRMETVRSPGSAGTHTQPEPQINSQANIMPEEQTRVHAYTMHANHIPISVYTHTI